MYQSRLFSIVISHWTYWHICHIGHIWLSGDTCLVLFDLQSELNWQTSRVMMTSIFTRFTIQSTDNCISANVNSVVSFHNKVDLSIKSFIAAVIVQFLIYWGRVPLFQLTDGLSPFCISKQIGQFSLLLQISTLHMHSVWFRKTDPYTHPLYFSSTSQESKTALKSQLLVMVIGPGWEVSGSVQNCLIAEEETLYQVLP